MSQTKQTRAERERRLEQGRCPIHGRFMGQVESWYYVVEEGPPLGVPMLETEILESMKKRAVYTIVQCSWGGCSIKAKSAGPDGPCELLPEWEHVLDDE